MADREMTLPVLGARLQESARRLGVAGFWPWWTAQLDACVPAAPRAALARRRMRPVLVFSGKEATLWLPSRDGAPRMVDTARIPLVGDATAIADAGRRAIGSTTRIVYGGAAAATRIVIALESRDVLRKQIVLPAAAEEGFRQALAYDLDRHTPFKADELYFDAAILERDRERGTLTVDLAAARRVVVDPMLRHAEGWGADVAAVVPGAPDSAAWSKLNLLPAHLRSGGSVWTRWQFWLPLALLGVFAAAAVAIPLWQKRDYAILLNALASEARARAAVSETLRQELDTRVADYNAALERKYAYPGTLRVVDDVSKLMPDDTWLTQFELKSVAKGKEMQRELLIRGETANAGRLVQLFEGSDLFAQAAPRSQTTKIQPGTGEIFDLGAQLKPLPKPDPIANLTGAAPTANPPVSADAGAGRAGAGGAGAGGAGAASGPGPAGAASGADGGNAKLVPPTAAASSLAQAQKMAPAKPEAAMEKKP